jgi:hypothetical protein
MLLEGIRGEAALDAKTAVFSAYRKITLARRVSTATLKLFTGPLIRRMFPRV